MERCPMFIVRACFIDYHISKDQYFNALNMFFIEMEKNLFLMESQIATKLDVTDVGNEIGENR